MASGQKRVSYASVGVSIPPDSARTVGEIQWPSSVPGDPARNFVTTSADFIDKDAFVSRISAEANKSRGKVLIFVHGFNNRFDDAVYRFAQIAHDSQRAGGAGAVHLAVARGTAAARLHLRSRKRQFLT